MANKLETEVSVTGVEQAYRNVDLFRERLEGVENILNSLGAAGRPFLEGTIQTFVEANAKVDQLYKKLNQQIKVNVDTGLLDSMSKRALGLKKEIGQVTTEIARLKIASLAENRPDVLLKMKQEGFFLEQQLVKIEGRLDSLAAKRAKQASASDAGQGATNLRNISGIASQVGGATIGDIAQTADTAVNMAEILKLSTGTAVAFGAIAAAGAIVVKVTQNIKEEAKAKLKLIEAVAIAGNREILAQKEVLKLFKEQREEKLQSIELQKRIDEGQLSSLKRERDTKTALRDLAPTGSNAQSYQQDIVALDEAIRKIEASNKTALDTSFSNWGKRYVEQMKGEKELANLEAKRLKETNEKLLELRNNTRDYFLDVQGSKNPLVKLMYDFETATDRANDRFKQFGKGFATQMANLEKANLTGEINKQLFAVEQRALKVNQEIRQLEGGDSRTQTKSDLQATLDRQTQELLRGNSTNPDVLLRLASRKREIDEYDRKQSERELDAKREDIEQQVRQIQNSKLDTRDKTSELLSATQGLSVDELGDRLKKVRVDALKQSVVDDRNQQTEAANVTKKLGTFIDNFNKQLTNKGMKVDLSDQAVTSISVQSKDLDVESQRKKDAQKKPTAADVAKQYAEYQNAL